MLKDLIIAFQSYVAAHNFITKHKLWKWILIPGIIYAILFVTGLYYFWVNSNELITYIFQQTGLAAWLDTMKEGLLNLLVIVAHLIIMSIGLSIFFSFFKYAFLVVGSPIFAYLSEKTDSIQTGKDFPFSISRLLIDAKRGISIAARNLLWQTTYLLAILLLSFIPVIGWVAPLIAFMVECYYFGFSMLDYSAERKNLSVQESIHFISAHRGLAIGNGMVFYGMHLIPVIGWVLAPSYAVIAATISIIDSEKKL